MHLLGVLDENKQLFIQSFSNILLIYLPSFFTSVIQPLDQGIIRSMRFELCKYLCVNAKSVIGNIDTDLTT